MTKLEIRFDEDFEQPAKIGLAKFIRDQLKEYGITDFVITDSTFSVGVSKSVSFKEQQGGR